LVLVPQPVSQEWLERATGYTDKPISQALQYLHEVGLVDKTHSGWQLIKENVNQLPLAVLFNDSSPKSVFDSGEHVGEGLQTHPDDPSPISDISPKSILILGRHDGDELSRNNSDPSKLEEVNLNNLNNSSSNNLNLRDENGKIPTNCENSEEIRKILDAAGELFGHEIIGELGDYSDIDRLIGWIAQAHCRRSTVKNPPGLVYWAFHQGKSRQPEKKYLVYPEQYLPESFLRACGQWIFED